VGHDEITDANPEALGLFAAQTHHAHGHDLESFFFDASNDPADRFLFHAVRFDDGQSSFHDRFFSRDVWSNDEDISRTDWYPTVDVSENKDEYLLNVDLPGLSKEDIHITFTNGMLKLEGERKKEKEEKERNYHRVERVFGKFCRTFQIPNKVRSEKISADFKDGILSIRLPKTEEVKPKEIEVKVS